MNEMTDPIFNRDHEGEVEEQSNSEHCEEEVEEEEFYEERVDWGFKPDEEIFDINDLKFKPYTTAITDKEKYQDACEMTATLDTHQFTQNLPMKMFKITYYDNPYQEYHVQGKFLKDVDTIKIIDLDANYDLIYHIVENEEILNQIKKIMFRNCSIQEELLKILCPKLEEAYFLTELDLSHNPIGDDGLKIIVKYLYYWTFLKLLNLYDTRITSAGLDKLASLYSKQRIFVTKLNLGWNRLNNHNSIKKLFAAFAKKMAPIEELRLSNCSLEGPETASHFYSYLINLKKLQFMDLSFNMFTTTDEAQSLAGLFVGSPTLEMMILTFNPLGDQVLVAMLDKIFESPQCQRHKTLSIGNVTMPQVYFKDKWKLFNRPDIKIMIAGVRKINLPKLDTVKYKFVKRFNFLYKKRRPRRDMVVKILEENLPAKKLKRIKVDDFKNALMMIGEIDFLMIQEIVNEFSGGGTRANVQEFIDIYNELFPPKLKTPKKTPQKRVKPKKIEEKKQEEGTNK